MHKDTVMAALGTLLLLGGCASEVEPGTVGASSEGIVGEWSSDDDEHPATAALLFNDLFIGGDGTGYFIGCSGVLMAEGVVVTAGHCTPPPFIPPVFARVSFHPHDAYNQHIPVLGWEAHPDAGFHNNDVGVIYVNPADTQGIEPQRLPNENFLGRLERAGVFEQNPQFTSVGYGFYDEDSAGDLFVSDGVRRHGISRFLLLNNMDLRVLHERGVDAGGCLADSGGPTYWLPNGRRADAHGSVVIGVHGGNNDADGECYGEGFKQRLDIPAVRNWLAPILGVQ